jgi:hypothetical protein
MSAKTRSMSEPLAPAPPLELGVQPGERLEQIHRLRAFVLGQRSDEGGVLAAEVDEVLASRRIARVLRIGVQSFLGEFVDDWLGIDACAFQHHFRLLAHRVTPFPFSRVWLGDRAVPSTWIGSVAGRRPNVSCARMDHRRLDVAVTLDRADVLTALEQMRRERVPQRIRADRLRDLSAGGRPPNRRSERPPPIVAGQRSRRQSPLELWGFCRC